MHLDLCVYKWGRTYVFDMLVFCVCNVHCLCSYKIPKKIYTWFGFKIGECTPRCLLFGFVMNAPNWLNTKIDNFSTFIIH